MVNYLVNRLASWPAHHRSVRWLFWGGLSALATVARGVVAPEAPIDFNRDIRPVLSENCISCHGPDEENRKGGEKGQGGLRLDTRAGALNLMDDRTAIVPGAPDQSELFLRVMTSDENDLMPPLKTGKTLTDAQKALLKKWIAQGAPYAEHWSYVPPVRPAVPSVSQPAWPANPIDHFVLNRIDQEKLTPAPRADRATLARRVSLDLTGLAPTPAEVEHFIADQAPNAYERLVDRLLAKNTFGEHWSRLWLDQARYADSAGYADDPLRMIWAYRDYLIRSFNANKPFDQFTIEQLAGDLLPHPTEDQLIATAFHRNTTTNSEGGTVDEEFRNMAVVDRVNTTMTVWMGSTMACAQCHTHKYDPFTQEDYFRLFAILNNTADADRQDEAPVLPLFTPERKAQRQQMATELAALEKTLSTRTPALLAAQPEWEAAFALPLGWQTLAPTELKSQAGAAMVTAPDGVITVARKGETDIYTFTGAVEAQAMTALRLETFPSDLPPPPGPVSNAGEFVITRIRAALIPAGAHEVKGRYLRFELPGQAQALSLQEVEVFSNGDNIAPLGAASQSSTVGEAVAKLAIDGLMPSKAPAKILATLTQATANPWWELDLKNLQAVERLVVWSPAEGPGVSPLAGAQVTLFDENRVVVWSTTVSPAPTARLELAVSAVQPLTFITAHADVTQDGFRPWSVLNTKAGRDQGWAVGGQSGRPHTIVLLPEVPVVVPAGAQLTVMIEQLSKKKNHTLPKLRLATTANQRAIEVTRALGPVVEALKVPAAVRSPADREIATAYYMTYAPALAATREQLQTITKRLALIEPYTTVPIMSELAGVKMRETHIQRRGNYLDLGPAVTPGLPGALHPLPALAQPNRLGLAQWIVDPKNPLTSRVIANLFWESIFGLGLVRTTEDFGSQGDLPSHPELLDWLAVEFRESHWDMKHLLRLMVTSSTYQQSAQISEAALARDSANQLLARGPRFRLTAEMIRDQTLAVSGLLSQKMYGVPVHPPQPKLGVAAAFGTGLDWQTSEGEDRYRRGIYTAWRRSNPYPSMSTFDAPSREVCLVRRERSNTPLQALVTLNDPVYIEAAQSLARRMAVVSGSPAEKLAHGFALVLLRAPKPPEQKALLALYAKSQERFARDAAQALAVATNPLGAAPAQMNVADLAAWTVVGNVLFNLDEFLMKP